MDNNHCPTCGKNIEKLTNYTEMFLKEFAQTYILHKRCAEQYFKPEDLKDVRKKVKIYNKKGKDPLIVLATYVDLLFFGMDHRFKCPACASHLPANIVYPLLTTVSGGQECGLCGLFIPDLPTMIYRPDGNLWEEK